MTDQPPPRAVLIVKTDTLGDLVLFGPALRALRDAWPDTRLAVLIRAGYADLAAKPEAPANTLGLPELDAAAIVRLVERLSTE